ncbi:TetR/AcrR family transcriptional regulator [Lysinibacter cavernae]|uniref:AcrR family transcriptional regulator n=1 Tax=Lysinibacter cavernae TaxID=1640652 RepID=A0A7X5TSY8_9MICO|nr:TetR/AcrR family transcriptional regulator [Lysinibacter cavernae]NIH53575.1 AcrR family transcriptional regulator [Lysinibacter cavernae]
MEQAVGTRDLLLAAASNLLTERGPDSVTLRQVGAAVGVSRTAPYRHFRDKDDLLSAVAAENLLRFEAEMRLGAEDTAAGGTPVYRAFLAYVAVACERPAHYRLIFGDFQINNPSEAQQAAAAACVNYLYELVEQGQRDGTLVLGDVRELTSLLWATLHGLVDLTLSRHLREPLTVEGLTSMPGLILTMLNAFAPPAS